MQGRPRDHDIDRAVLAATLAVLDESGYSRLVIGEVAHRAGTTKPAVYRRWPARPHLVLAALATRLAEIDTPDTGCTLCDLNECLVVFVDAFHRIRPDVLGPLLADCSADPDLRRRFMATLFDPPRTAVARTVDVATARGDLRADLDRDLLLDMLGSLVHYRALFQHEPLDPAEIVKAVETLLRGAAADYPRLLAHSLRSRPHPAHPRAGRSPEAGPGRSRVRSPHARESHMSEDRSDQEPTYGEETDQQPHYPADGGTASPEDGADEAPESGDGAANPDLHGAAREVADGASGDGAAKTPGA